LLRKTGLKSAILNSLNSTSLLNWEGVLNNQ
jgi:hypothetical protein